MIIRYGNTAEVLVMKVLSLELLNSPLWHVGHRKQNLKKIEPFEKYRRMLHAPQINFLLIYKDVWFAKNEIEK